MVLSTVPDSQQIIVLEVIQEGLVDKGAWCHDSRDTPVENSCRGRGILRNTEEFFAQGDEAFVSLHEGLEMPIQVMRWETAHEHALPTPWLARQFDVEELRYLCCLLKVRLRQASAECSLNLETAVSAHLVKLPNASEQYTMRPLGQIAQNLIRERCLWSLVVLYTHLQRYTLPTKPHN